MYQRHLAIAGALLLVSCSGLPRSVRNEIASEKARLEQADRQLQHSRTTLREDLAHAPDLFQGASVTTEWPQRLDNAKASLDRAKEDERQLERLSQSSERPAAERLLREERTLRESAVRNAESVEADANNWLDFQRNLPHYLATMEREYAQIHGVDLAPVAKTVEKAEQDWPAKKSDLDARLASLRQSLETAEMQWSATESARRDAAAGKASGPEVATLIQANDVLERDSTKLTHGADDLRSACGQLYDSWDKILADLEVAHRGGENIYTEKLKTVRTHFVDVASKKTEVSSEDKWVDVSAPEYHAVENDLGMAIAHKDAGQFDSEAQNKAQPPGFAYIAPPSQGANQYGYWTHSGGESIWTFLPQYLIMRELLWGHSYRPVVVNEYRGYETAQRSGRTYYGQETPAAPPKYGSHGTFTAQNYASSRYVQSGGYKASAYASNRAASPASRPEPRFGSAPSDSSAGRRFGSGTGQRFGTPRSPSRMPGRSFGRRR